MIAATVSEIHPAGLAEALAARQEKLSTDRFGERLLAADASLWPDTDAAGQRLGWLRLPTASAAELPAFGELAEEVRSEGVKDIVLFGMGGSSLGPEVLSRLLATEADGRRLTVVDTTHPATVAACLEAFPPATSLYVASSKSGTTVETSSLLDTFWHSAREDGSRFVAITDRGSALADRAEAQGFRRLVLSPTDVGGRYSVLSPFGLLPATLAGIDCTDILDAARGFLGRAEEAVKLGALLAEAVLAGRDKLTFLADPATEPLLPWLEQLLAESLGKRGTGLVPIFGEPDGVHYGDDRVFVRLTGDSEVSSLETDRELLSAGHPVVRLLWPGPTAVGAEMMRWELATAAAGAILDVDPFSQPDVDLAKQLARAAMTDPAVETDPTIVDAGDEDAFMPAIAFWLETAAPGDYIVLQAFLPPSTEVMATLEGLRANLAATGLPTTLGFGPRFLHSTGQLHKGGRGGVFCLQLFDGEGADVEIPGAGYSFRQLIDAQALGDARALAQRGRSVLRVRLGD